MGTTPRLLIAEVAQTQAQWDQTVNDGFVDLENAITDTYAIDFTSANINLSVTAMVENQFFLCQNVNTDRTLTFPANVTTFDETRRVVIVHNESTNVGNVSIVPSGGTQIVNLIPGGTAVIYLKGAVGYLASVYSSTTPSSDTSYDTSIFISGAPATNDEVFRYMFPRTVTYSSNFSGSRASVRVNPTNNYTFTIDKNGSNVGNLQIDTAGTAVFATNSAATVVFAPGDVLTVNTSSVADATLNDIGITLVGTKS